MSLGSPKAYQVLAILDNPTFKPLTRGSQEINEWISMDGVHLPYQVLAQVILRDFKLTKKIKTINGSHFLFIKNWNNETFTFVSGTLPSFFHSKKQKA